MEIKTIIEIVSGTAAFLAALVGLVWWLSQRLADLVKSQSSMKEELTATLMAQITAGNSNTAAMDTKLVKLQSSLDVQTATFDQKLTTLQNQLEDVSDQLKENRDQTNELRDRVTRIETICDFERKAKTRAAS